MDISWLRDLVIVIFGILGAVAAIVLMVVAIKLGRKLGPILDSVRNTSDTIGRAVALVSDIVVKPIITVYGWVRGVRRALAIIAKLLRKEGEEE